MFLEISLRVSQTGFSLSLCFSTESMQVETYCHHTLWRPPLALSACYLACVTAPYILFNSYFDLSISVVQGVEPALHQQRPLEAESCDEEVVTHRAEAVALKKCHQEAESNKDHHMDVLETWAKKGEKGEVRRIIGNGTKGRKG